MVYIYLMLYISIVTCNYSTKNTVVKKIFYFIVTHILMTAAILTQQPTAQKKLFQTGYKFERAQPFIDNTC